MKCRFCRVPLEAIFLDLGSAPPSNSYLDLAGLSRPESWFPLRLFVCRDCLLVQIDEVQHHTNLFSADYAYFSSYSRSWLEHARRFVADAQQRLSLGPAGLVVEIASNDGYLLQYVAEAGIPCLGIEPTAGTAEAARAKGIETWSEFFGLALARRIVSERGYADLIVANNVLAHVPDLNDFVAGLSHLLDAESGVLTVEFPHLLSLMAERQFDTVYHEHFSYFSLHTVQRVFAAHGLKIWDVEVLSTHGGSLRIWAATAGSTRKPLPSLERELAREVSAGMLERHYYNGFQAQANAVKDGLLRFLLEQKSSGRKVVGYGAAAKGNTLLNYAGIRSDLLPYVVDASPHKQGRYLPGSRIPVVTETQLIADRPDVVLILPWNLREEISEQLRYVREWGGVMVTAVPGIEVF